MGIAALLVLDKMRRKLGFDTAVPSLHMCFTGAPGTGKTTVAVRMGQILAKMGYCRSGHVVVATRDDLVGQYVGHTAPKTKEVIKQALGGVLLVDEAYYLYNAANDRDYGQESIEILLTFMENNREDLVVVLAGYKDRMASSSPSSRACRRASATTSTSRTTRSTSSSRSRRHVARPRLRDDGRGRRRLQEVHRAPHGHALLLERAHRAQRDGPRAHERGY